MMYDIIDHIIDIIHDIIAFINDDVIDIIGDVMVSMDDVEDFLRDNGPSNLPQIAVGLNVDSSQVQWTLRKMMQSTRNRRALVTRFGQRGSYIYELTESDVALVVSSDPEPSARVIVRPMMPPVNRSGGVPVPVSKIRELLDAFRSAVSESQYSDGSTVSRKRLLERLSEIESHL